MVSETSSSPSGSPGHSTMEIDDPSFTAAVTELNDQRATEASAAAAVTSAASSKKRRFDDMSGGAARALSVSQGPETDVPGMPSFARFGSSEILNGSVLASPYPKGGEPSHKRFKIDRVNRVPLFGTPQELSRQLLHNRRLWAESTPQPSRKRAAASAELRESGGEGEGGEEEEGVGRSIAMGCISVIGHVLKVITQSCYALIFGRGGSDETQQLAVSTGAGDRKRRCVVVGGVSTPSPHKIPGFYPEANTPQQQRRQEDSTVKPTESSPFEPHDAGTPPVRRTSLLRPAQHDGLRRRKHQGERIKPFTAAVEETVRRAAAHTERQEQYLNHPLTYQVAVTPPLSPIGERTFESSLEISFGGEVVESVEFDELPVLGAPSHARAETVREDMAVMGGEAAARQRAAHYTGWRAKRWADRSGADLVRREQVREATDDRIDALIHRSRVVVRETAEEVVGRGSTMLERAYRYREEMEAAMQALHPAPVIDEAALSRAKAEADARLAVRAQQEAEDRRLRELAMAMERAALEARQAEEEEAEQQAAAAAAAEEEAAIARAEAEAAAAAASKVFTIGEPLSESWSTKVDSIIQASGESTDVLARSTTNTDLTRSTFNRVLNDTQSGVGSWLDDEAVNAFIESFVAAKNAGAGWVRTNNAVAPPFAAYSSQWWETYQSRGVGGLRTWSRRKGIKGERLLRAKKIFLPINRAAHWVLVVINVEAKSIEYLDSLTGDGEGEVRVAREWLRMELGDLYHENQWSHARSRSQRQLNMNDCGVFTCFNALASAQEVSYREVTAAKMPLARRQLAAVLLNGGFSGDFEL